MNLEMIQSDFAEIFRAPPERVIRAPGRVNLIGEHTDYNAGFVLPMAIDREVVIAARVRADHIVRMVAQDFNREQSEFALDAIRRDDTYAWSNYLRGVAYFLQERGIKLSGLDLLIHGNVPIGAGLSSSAALEVCAAVTFQVFSRRPRELGAGSFVIDKIDLAKLCQQAENDFVGVKSGIMDQFVSLLARKDHALLIDCRALSHQFVPLPKSATIVICDTMKRRGLVDSEYNARRAECEEAVRLLGEKSDRPIKTLRDVSASEFARFERDLPPIPSKRARHVIHENERVLNAVAALKKNDLVAFGRLMNASHESLKNDYKVSCEELDAMVGIARKQPGCFGARLTGAGFGGGTVNLVKADTAPAFIDNVAREYQARYGIEPQIYTCRAMDGAGVAA